jgi:hypothetical protein
MLSASVFYSFYTEASQVRELNSRQTARSGQTARMKISQRFTSGLLPEVRQVVKQDRPAGYRK